MYGPKSSGNKHGNKDKYESPNPHRVHTIMSPEDVSSGKKSSWHELEITGSIRNLSATLWEFEHLTSLYLNDNSLTKLPPDIMRLKNLVCLDLSSNKLRSLPAELGEIVNLRELLLQNNCLRILPFELGRLFQLQNLALTDNPLIPDIMRIYKEPNRTQKLVNYLLDHLISDIRPPVRPWVQLAQPHENRPVGLFTVMCYNVLCDKYATRQLYGYCPSWALNWEYRKKVIINELLSSEADIISLQEVETDQFDNFFSPQLREAGYEGIFSPKSRARTMAEAERKFVDGCAIFYKKAQFSLRSKQLIEFNQMAISAAEGSHDMINRVMTKDNIGLAAVLEIKDALWTNGHAHASAMPVQYVLVATCHIHWDPEFCDVKLIQTMMLMHQLKNIADEFETSLRPGASRDLHQKTPLILCGDLNSTPDSGVVEYLSMGSVAANHVDFKGLGYEDCLRKLSNSGDSKDMYMHNFKLSQAYNKELMPYTNYTYDFKGIIDYIFYSSDLIRPLGVLGCTEEDWFSQNKILGCPNPQIPSDHLPLLVKLEMSSQHQQQGNSISNRQGGGGANYDSRLGGGPSHFHSSMMMRR